MESPYHRYASVEERAELVRRVQRRELEKLREHERVREAQRWEAEQRKELRELLNDPGQAAEVLKQATSKLDAPGGISSILLDNSTLAHAGWYFSDAHRDGLAHARLPARPRLMLLAVADFVNAVILYENVLTGPTGGLTTYAPREQSLGIACSVSGRLSERETFAVLALAKATAAEAVREQEAVDTASALLGLSLRADGVLRWLSAIDLIASRTSAAEYYDDPTLNVFESRQTAVTAIDPAHYDRTRPEESPHSPLYDWGIRPEVDPERFAAMLIYRTHVYLYLADLLGLPYSADALRKNLIPPQPRRGFAERVTTLVGEAQNTRDDQVNDLLGFEAFKVRIPLVLKYVLSRASTPSEVLEITLETRESRPARRFREYCARVDTAIAEGKRDDVARACAELSSYGVRLGAELPGQRPAGQEAVQAAKELVSVGSPLLGALIPGLALAAGHADRRIRHRKFALIEQLTRTPRNLNEIAREFARLWPGL